MIRKLIITTSDNKLKSTISIWILIGMLIGIVVIFQLKEDALKEQISDLNLKNTKYLTKFENNIQFNKAAITYQTERQRKLIFIRDQIMKENQKVKMNEAYDYAENIIVLSEKYQSFDEFFLCAIQKNESNFDTNAISSKGAIGLSQIWPSTGRMLCKMIGWEFSEKMLKDPKKNSHLAAVYLDLLNITYNGNKELILAEYNGGPVQAALFEKKKKVCDETWNYVRDVMVTYQKYKQLYEKT